MYMPYKPGLLLEEDCRQIQLYIWIAGWAVQSADAWDGASREISTNKNVV